MKKKAIVILSFLILTLGILFTGSAISQRHHSITSSKQLFDFMKIHLHENQLTIRQDGVIYISRIFPKENRIDSIVVRENKIIQWYSDEGLDLQYNQPNDFADGYDVIGGLWNIKGRKSSVKRLVGQNAWELPNVTEIDDIKQKEIQEKHNTILVMFIDHFSV